MCASEFLSACVHACAGRDLCVHACAGRDYCNKYLPLYTIKKILLILDRLSYMHTQVLWDRAF